MKIIILLIILLISSIHAKEHHNHLFSETSPYLQQHASNPVEWYPWSEAAFQKAQKENKPIFLSIGYSTCHWCHVMKRESFESEEIARLLNRYFISIKVDREEMPHIDAYYQELHMKIHNRSAGWPLSVFMTPDKKVFHITGYIPSRKESYSKGFRQLIPELAQLYSDKKRLKRDFHSIEAKIKKHSQKSFYKDITIQHLVEALKESYDDIYGGFGSSRKFPEAAKLTLMMDLSIVTQDKELEDSVYEMLDTMALRGLYDHVEGGFFRYSVDAAWEIPHFEKMLYNQAELIMLYTKAYIRTGKELYKNVVIQTIEMVLKRFTFRDLFFSASDAESNSEEGLYFIFSSVEIEEALKDLKNKEEILELINYDKEGNFEGKTHINLFDENSVVGFDVFIKRLQKIRAKKEYPFIDKKINTAWNAMMIEALYRASLIDEKYTYEAQKHLKALKEMMFKKGELYHQGVIGRVVVQKGLLEDYSFLVSALITAYEVSYDEDKLYFAEYLLNSAKQNFYEDGVWYLNHRNPRVKAGTKDKYYTSALSKMLQNYLNIASLKGSFRYEKVVLKSLRIYEEIYKEKHIDAPALASTYLMQKYGIVVVKSSKENLLKYAKEIGKIKYPYLLSKEADYRDFLACSMRRCFAKEKDLNKMAKSIEALILQN